MQAQTQHDTIAAIELKPEYLTQLPKIGKSKAIAIVEVCPTLGDLVGFTARDLVSFIKGLSEDTATSVLNWAQSEWTRLTATVDTAGEDQGDSEGPHSDVLPDEEPEHDDELAVLEIVKQTVRRVAEAAPAPRKEIQEVRPQFDKTIVYRSDS